MGNFLNQNKICSPTIFWWKPLLSFKTKWRLTATTFVNILRVVCVNETMGALWYILYPIVLGCVLECELSRVNKFWKKGARKNLVDTDFHWLLFAVTAFLVRKYHQGNLSHGKSFFRMLYWNCYIIMLMYQLLMEKGGPHCRWQITKKWNSLSKVCKFIDS